MTSGTFPYSEVPWFDSSYTSCVSLPSGHTIFRQCAEAVDFFNTI